MWARDHGVISLYSRAWNLQPASTTWTGIQKKRGTSNAKQSLNPRSCSWQPVRSLIPLPWYLSDSFCSRSLHPQSSLVGSSRSLCARRPSAFIFFFLTFTLSSFCSILLLVNYPESQHDPLPDRLQIIQWLLFVYKTKPNKVMTKVKPSHIQVCGSVYFSFI